MTSSTESPSDLSNLTVDDVTEPQWRRRAGWAKRATADLSDALLRLLFRLLPSSPRTERWAVAWAFRYRGRPRFARLRYGGEVWVDPTDYLQALVCYTGLFEPHCHRVLARLLRPGHVAVDIGANIGIFSVFMGRAVGPSGRVVAVEAVPPHVDVLTRNLRRNRLEQVTVVATAVGANEGELVLSRPKGGNRGAFTAGGVDSVESYSVTVRRLDDVLAECDLPQVDVLKMDIEGSECAALRGAERLLAEQRPTLLMELNATALERCGASCAEAVSLLTAAGYRGWSVRPRGLEAMTTGDEVTFDECVFVHPSRRDHLRALRLDGA